MIKSKIPEKNAIKIRVSNLVKLKLWHMDVYDGAATEQQVELLKKLGICHRMLLFLHAIEPN